MTALNVFLVKPIAEVSNCSLAETLKAKAAIKVGRLTQFVSHSWRGSFKEFTASLHKFHQLVKPNAIGNPTKIYDAFQT